MELRNDLTRFASPLPAMHHVGVIVRDAVSTARAFAELGGFAVSEAHDFSFADALVRGERTSFAARYVFVQATPVAIEFIEPRSESGVYADFLAEQGEGVHHFAFPVDDFAARIDGLVATGQSGSIVTQAQVPALNRFAYVEGVPGMPLVELVDTAG